MCDQDEVQRILQKTRAQRERLNRHLIEVGDSPHPIRSPLREKNVEAVRAGARTATEASSPTKVVRTSTFTKKAPTPGIGSPTRIRTNALVKRTEKEKEKLPRPDKKEETVNREVTEKKTTVEDSPVKEDDGRETVTRTTITEKEEKVHRRQYVRFTGLTEENVDKLITRYADDSGEDDVNDDEGTPAAAAAGITTTTTTKTVTQETARSPSPSARSRSRSASASPVKRRSTPSPSKKTPSAGGIVTSARRQLAEYDEETFGESGRKKRLAALAKKFQRYDDEDEASAVATPPGLTATPTAQDLSVTKEVDVDEELAGIEEAAAAAAEQRGRQACPSPTRMARRTASPAKKNAASRDPAFLKSLRAQGFEETESKTKLVYDFGRQQSPAAGRAAILSSPTKTAAEPRPTSPFKPHPLQFVSPQVNKEVAAAAKATPPPPSQPSQAPQPPPKPVGAHRPYSPYKQPHPMQFISPQRSNSPSRRVPASEPPNKPARTWTVSVATSEEEDDNGPVTSSAEFCTPQARPAAARPPLQPPQSEPMTDTASRRSVAEKWSMFEGQRKGDPSPPSVDPSLMSLSERRALFERNRTAPKAPVARFGEAVTPSMLTRAQNQTGNVAGQPKQLFSRRSPPKKPRAPSPPPAIKRPASPDQKQQPSPKRIGGSPSRRRSASPKKMVLKEDFVEQKERSPKKKSPRRSSPTKSDESGYPGVNSLKRIKVSPPKPGGLYPQLVEGTSSEDDNGSTRPNTAMSGESEAASEAPSLGMAIKRAASAQKLLQDRKRAMPSISETSRDDDDGDQNMSGSVADDGDIDEMLDEAMDDSGSTVFRSEGPTPPKHPRNRSPAKDRRGLSPTQSAASWEFATPSAPHGHNSHPDKFKTPLVEAVEGSPQGLLPEVEGQEGSTLLHTVSFYRRQKPAGTASASTTPLQKIVRRAGPMTIQEGEGEGAHQPTREEIQRDIRKLQEEAEEQRQRMEQASKALNFCVSQGEFEGSSERVEGERLLLEATHKYTAACAEIRRLTTEGAIGKADTAATMAAAQQGRGLSRGSISISGLSLPLKADFVRMLRDGALEDAVHYFLVLFKYRHRVIATQMLSTAERGGVGNGRLVFPNLINMRDLDFDFQIHVEVYGLQTRREHLPHDVKYHIRKEKSMFNLTPLKILKKQESHTPSRHQNPVNSKTIRRPAFGMVGYALINIQTLKQRAFILDKVPPMSPLDGGLEMTLTIHSENKIEQRGFLTFFTDANGYGDWCRRWCRLSGNALHFWKYPEDENKTEPSERICLTTCVTEEVSLAPREISSRMNTFMLETRRPTRQGDRESLVMQMNRKTGQTTLRHLLSADTREERVGWCGVVNRALQNIRAWDPTAFRPRSSSQSSVESSGTQGSSASTDIW